MRRLTAVLIVCLAGCDDDDDVRAQDAGRTTDAALDAARAIDAGQPLDAASVQCNIDPDASCPLDWHENGPCCDIGRACSRGCFAYTAPDGGRGGWESFFSCQPNGTVGAGKGLFECTPSP